MDYRATNEPDGSVRLRVPKGTKLYLTEITVGGVQSKLSPPIALYEHESIIICTRRKVEVNWMEGPSDP